MVKKEYIQSNTKLYFEQNDEPYLERLQRIHRHLIIPVCSICDCHGLMTIPSSLHSADDVQE